MAMSLLAAFSLLACTITVDGRSSGRSRLPTFSKPAITESLGEGVQPPDEKDLPSFVTRQEDQEGLKSEGESTYLFTMTGCDYKSLEKHTKVEDRVKAAIKATVAAKMGVELDDVSDVEIEGAGAQAHAAATSKSNATKANATANATEEDVLEADRKEEQEESQDNGEEAGEETEEEKNETEEGEDSETADSGEEADDSGEDSGDGSEDQSNTEDTDTQSDDAGSSSLLEVSQHASMYAVVTVNTAGSEPHEIVGLGTSVSKAINNVTGIDDVTGGTQIVVADPDIVTKGPEGEKGSEGPSGPAGPNGTVGKDGEDKEMSDEEANSKGYAPPWMVGGGVVVHLVSIFLVYRKLTGQLAAGRADIQKLAQGGAAA